MEVTATVLHDGALAEYEVELRGGGVCTAHLARYKGNPDHTPPRTITLRKEGRRWTSDVADRDLSEGLGYAVETKAKPLIYGRGREGGHPAA